VRHLSDENYDEALDAFSQAIRLDPTLAFAYYNRGLTRYYKNDEDLAIEDFNRALELGFGDALLFRNRGNAFSRKGDVERALADYAQGIALDPGNALAYVNRGQVYENTLRKDLAIADYKTVLTLGCEPQIEEHARKRLLAMGVKPSAAPSPPALVIWRKKLAFLQVEEANAADAEQKFSIQQRIDEARAKIWNLNVDA
jgi:regulator of sirC expression with transglutaminase-like and TPR domain